MTRLLWQLRPWTGAEGAMLCSGHPHPPYRLCRQHLHHHCYWHISRAPDCHWHPDGEVLQILLSAGPSMNPTKSELILFLRKKQMTVLSVSGQEEFTKNCQAFHNQESWIWSSRIINLIIKNHEFDHQESWIWSSRIMHLIIKNHACYNIKSVIASLIATYKRYALVFYRSISFHIWGLSLEAWAFWTIRTCLNPYPIVQILEKSFFSKRANPTIYPPTVISCPHLM